MENIQTGLVLVAVGMTTVFIILLIVIYLGKGLIALVNKYAPEEVVVKKQAPPRMVAATVASTTTAASVSAISLSDQETAAIVSAISAVTGGQGKVTQIKKIQ